MCSLHAKAREALMILDKLCLRRTEKVLHPAIRILNMHNDLNVYMAFKTREAPVNVDKIWLRRMGKVLHPSISSWTCTMILMCTGDSKQESHWWMWMRFGSEEWKISFTVLRSGAEPKLCTFIWFTAMKNKPMWPGSTATACPELSVFL